MNPTSYRERFPRRAVFPVIHIYSQSQVARNLDIVATSGADGVWLIDHAAGEAGALFKALTILSQDGWFSKLWVGANFLGTGNAGAMTFTEALGLNGLWSDNALVDDPHTLKIDLTRKERQRQAQRNGSRFPLYFGGVAFKGQPQDEDWTAEARKAVPLVDVITTSGPATGQPADIEKLRDIRKAIGDHPLAVASGVTAQNVTEQLKYVDAVLVATGINVPGDFYHIDPERLRELVEIVHAYQPPN